MINLRIRQIFILTTFIALVLLSLVPIYDISGNSTTNDIGFQTDQPTNSYQLQDALDNTLDLNLTGAVALVNRTMSIIRTGQVIVNDTIQVKIIESNTTISMFNYSIPTVFAEKLTYIEFYSLAIILY